MASEAPGAEKARPIIVIRRKAAGHGGHHGGAWKVAYADFVTALMALFIVLWLMGQDEEVKKAISAYFNNPTGTGKQIGTSVAGLRSEEHTSELQSLRHLVCRLLLEKKTGDGAVEPLAWRHWGVVEEPGAALSAKGPRCDFFF